MSSLFTFLEDERNEDGIVTHTFTEFEPAAAAAEAQGVTEIREWELIRGNGAFMCVETFQFRDGSWTPTPPLRRRAS